MTILSASSLHRPLERTGGPTSLLTESVRDVYRQEKPLPLLPPSPPPPAPSPEGVAAYQGQHNRLRQVGDAVVSVVRSSTSQGPLVVSTQPLTRIQDCCRHFSRQQLAVDVLPLESRQRYRCDSRVWLMLTL